VDGWIDGCMQSTKLRGIYVPKYFEGKQTERQMDGWRKEVQINFILVMNSFYSQKIKHMIKLESEKET
jgi:pyruvate dehydrogenase complex dehydrogenase (E1) component